MVLLAKTRADLTPLPEKIEGAELGCGRSGSSLSQSALVPVGTQDFHLAAEDAQTRRNPFIFFDQAGDFPVDRTLGDETLELLVGPQTQHFFAAASRVPFPEIEEDDFEQGLKLE